MRPILRVMIDEKPAFFIVGCWESGTNIVQDIVNRHPAICRADNGPRADAPVKVVHVIRDGRDAAVAAWQKEHPDRDVFEDRKLALPSRTEISLEKQIRAVRTALETRC